MKSLFSIKPIVLGGRMLIFLSILLLFTTCDVGLGMLVNTEKPVIKNAGDNLPGSFLQGTENKIELDVSNSLGFKIDTVFIEVEYIDVNDGLTKTKKVFAQQDPVTGEWFVNLDVSDMTDGKITSWVTAIDESGNLSKSTGIVYMVKNKPPQIEMTIPGIKGINFDNIYNDGTPGFLDELITSDPIFVGFDLMGLATDDFGIASGYPKIQFWRKDDPSANLNSDGIPTNPVQAAWREMVLSNTSSNPTSTRITWPMVQLIADSNAPGGYRLPKSGEPVTYLGRGDYCFRIVTKDLFGNENYYPNRSDNTLGTGGKPLAPNDPSYPYKYITFNYMVAEIPIANIRDTPDYFNGIGDFPVKIQISSVAALTSIKIFLAANQENLNKGLEVNLNPSTYQTANQSIYDININLKDFTEYDTISKWPAPSGNSPLFLHVVATDNVGKTNPQSIKQFIFDTNAPAVNFTQPVNITNITPSPTGEFTDTGVYYDIYYPNNIDPKWVTGTVTIGGSASDPSKDNYNAPIPSSIIQSVSYHIGKILISGTYKDERGLSGQQLKDFYNTIPWKDTLLNSMQPANGWSGNVNTWFYTNNFNTWKTDTSNKNLVQEAVELGFTDSNGGQPVTIDKTGTNGRSRFYLPFYVKVVDGAGNIKIVHYKLCIDPDMDIPYVNINYPTDDMLLGGEVRVSGTASDNISIDRVLVRIQRADTPTAYYRPKINGIQLPSFYTANPSYNNSAFWDPSDNTTVKREGWFEAIVIGNGPVVGWYIPINGDMGLDPPVNQTEIGVKIEVRAIDFKENLTTPNLLGTVENVNVNFSSEVPTITGSEVIRLGILSSGDTTIQYAEGIRASGRVKFSMYVNEAKGFSNIKARFGSNAFQDIVVNNNVQGGLPAGWTATKINSGFPDTSRPYCYKLEFEIDTKTIANYGVTGNLILDLDVSNVSTPPLKATARYTLEIDNYFPKGDVTTAPAGSGNKFLISGTAKDYVDGRDMHQGLERVLVYFERAKVVYSTANVLSSRKVVGTGVYVKADNTAAPTGDILSYPAGSLMDTTITGYNENSTTSPNNTADFKFPKLNLTTISGNPVWTSTWAMVIDNQEIGENTDSDGDGTFGEIWDGLVDKTWGARFDTTKFPEGPLMVHYIIMDKAGNSTHLQKPLTIENKKPVIMSINMGTDVDMNGTVTDYTSSANPGEYRSEFTNVGQLQQPNSLISYTPAFRARGNRIAFDINTQLGEGSKYYKAYYAVENAALVDVTNMVMGNVYTITAEAGNTDYKQYGAPMNSQGITFVATGAPKTGSGATGTVKEYTTTQVGSGSVTLNGNTEARFTINTTSYTGITDSPKTNGIVNDSNKRFFIIKIYDTAVPQVEVSSVMQAAPEWEQNAHAVLVAMDIDNTDQAAPSLNSAPFGQEYGLKTSGTNLVIQNDDAKELKTLSNNDYNNNIVMTGDERQGYVQYAYNTDGTIATGTADISGKVVFLGKAADNQRIKNITVTIPGFNGGNAFTVATSPDAGGMLTSSRTTMGTGTTAWYFIIKDQSLTLDYGHVINWEFAWDSSEVANQVSDAINVTFSVNDYRTTGNAVTSARGIRIVPYISEITTGLSGAYDPPSAFARSSNGWYPVRENEVITIKGFNLGTATITGVTINNTALTQNATNPPASGNFRVVSKSEIQANVGTGTTSGELVVRVGNTNDNARTSSINNSTKKYKTTPENEANRVHYNWEPNGANNNNLTNNRKLYIWNTGYVINDKEMLNPFMRMSDNGTRHVSLGRYNGTNSQGNLKVIVNNTGLSAAGALQFANNDTGNGTALYQTNRFIHTTIGVTGNGEWAVVSSNITSSQSNLTLVYNTIGAGNGNENGTTTNNATSMKQRLRNFGSDPYRAQVPRIAIQRTSNTSGGRTYPARMVLSYYDAAYTTNPIVLHYGHNNGVNAPTWTGNIPNANADNPPTPAVGDNGSGVIVATNATATAKSGKFTAVGMLSSGRPIIAWYDSITDGGCLWFSFGPEPTAANIMPTNTFTTTVWQNNARKVATGFGTHVDMAVDGNNNVHLAYVNSNNGGLYYAFIPSATVTSANQSAFDNAIKKARVDTFLSTGQKLMINVRGNIPYISYIHNAFAESKNSIRVAWAKTAITAVANVKDGTIGNYFTGDWEVMTVPAESIPKTDEFVCNGVPTSGTLAQPSGSTLRAYANISTSIFITYMTDKWYEGAVIKANIPSLTY